MTRDEPHPAPLAHAPLVVAPIGTCRIHTPVRKGTEQYPIKAQLARNYGFVHTSSEALQQLRFMLRDQAPPPNVQILAFRNETGNATYDKPHVPADLYLVELSSTKLLTVDGFPIQINYMTRYFGDFFSDRQRARKFWSMSSENKLAERQAWLQEDPVFKRLAPGDRDLLAGIVRHMQSNEHLEREMHEIAELVGKDKLAFVTHVDATTPDNMVMEQRHRLIGSVRAIAENMGVPCYDPTPRMLDFGQSNAMEKGGLDLTHYTEQFIEQLSDDLFTQLFAPRLAPQDALSLPNQNRQPEISVDEAASIESAWNAGQLRDASQRVRSVLRLQPGRREHRMLFARMQLELGDFEGVIGAFDPGLADAGSNEQAEQLLMHAYYGIGKYREANRLASALLADERETPEILRVCAESATRLGDRDTALTCWKRLFRISEDAAGAAEAVLDLFLSAGDIAGAAYWGDEVRAALPLHAPSYVAQWQGKLMEQDREGLMALADDPIRLDAAIAFDLVQRASKQGFALAAATLAVAQDLPGNPDAKMAKWLAQQNEQWLNKGLAALDSGSLLVAADRIQANVRLAPKATPTIRANRALERRLRTEARVALIAKDYPQVLAIGSIALGTGAAFPELDIFLGRAADALGDTQTALRHLGRAADEVGAPVSVRIQLARVAVRGHQYREAIDAYCDVAANDSADQAVRDEAQRNVTGLRGLAIRGARELLAREEYDDAWSLLNRIETASPDGMNVAQEKRRVLSALHIKVRTLDSSSNSERLALCEIILRHVPTDTLGLKAAAVAAMRLHRFTQSLAYWQALREVTDNNEQIDNYIRKCLMWIERAKHGKNSGAALDQHAA